TTPSFRRRCLAPIRYWNIHVRLPPERMRTPKPGTSSSNSMWSVLPAGNFRRATLFAVSFMAEHPGENLGSTWEALSCFPATDGGRPRQRVSVKEPHDASLKVARDASRLFVSGCQGGRRSFS